MRAGSFHSLVIGGILVAALAYVAPSRTLEPPTDDAKRRAVWKSVEPGLDLATLQASRPPVRGDGLVYVLRIDPSRFELRLLNASASPDGRPRTARGWARHFGLVAAINASLYQGDYRTSTSLMTTRTHTNNPRLSKDKAVLAFDPLEPGLPPVQIIDRTCQDLNALRTRYGTLVQSIRMLSCDGRNVWKPQERSTSTAAIGIDRSGRVLFIHVRSHYTTHDLVDVLLDLPIGLARAMYVEGGTEAQLYLSSGDLELELLGSHESGLDGLLQTFPIPNVIGVARRLEVR